MLSDIDETMEVSRDAGCYVTKVTDEDEEIKTVIEEISSRSSSSSITTSQIKSKLVRYYRRPSTKIAFIPSLRVLKRDIRRRYVDMISNVINSHDAVLFSSFVDEFYHPNFYISHSYPEDSRGLLRPLCVVGRDNAKNFHLTSFHLIPDGIELHSDIKICKRLNESGSRIVGNLEKSGTILYLPKEIKGVAVDRNNSLTDCLPSLDTPPPPVHSQEDLMNNFQLGAQPLKMIMRSTYQIVLDENHRILSFQKYCYELRLTRLSQDEVYRE